MRADHVELLGLGVLGSKCSASGFFGLPATPFSSARKQSVRRIRESCSKDLCRTRCACSVVLCISFSIRLCTQPAQRESTELRTPVQEIWGPPSRGCHPFKVVICLFRVGCTPHAQNKIPEAGPRKDNILFWKLGVRTIHKPKSWV